MKKPQPPKKIVPISANNPIHNFSQVNHIEVTQDQHDQRIDNFLLSRLKGLPKSHLYKMIRSDEVRINNKRCKAYDRLYVGDIVRIAPVRIATREQPIISEEMSKSLLERIVYEDDGLIVLNKPHGLAVHGGSGLNFGVIEAMRDILSKSYLELVHRIDKDTSGLLMISKKRSTLKKLQEHLREKHIQKYYLAIVQGHITLDEQSIDQPLLRYTVASGERRVKVDHKDPNSKSSQTDIKVLERFTYNDQKVTLVQVMPRTGRTHQIRVHMTYIGHPLLGDDKYNSNDPSKANRLCLHAWKLEIPDYPMISFDLSKDKMLQI